MVKTTEFPPRGSSSRKRRSCKFRCKKSDHFLGVLIFFNSSALLSPERKELFNSISTIVDSTHLPARRIINSCFWNVHPPQFLLNWCLGCERWVFFNVPVHIFHRYPAFKLFQTTTQILRAAAERARSLGHLFGFHGKRRKAPQRRRGTPSLVLKSSILGSNNAFLCGNFEGIPLFSSPFWGVWWILDGLCELFVLGGVHFRGIWWNLKFGTPLEKKIHSTWGK